MENRVSIPARSKTFFFFPNMLSEQHSPLLRTYLCYSYGNTAVGMLSSPPSSVGG